MGLSNKRLLRAFASPYNGKRDSRVPGVASRLQRAIFAVVLAGWAMPSRAAEEPYFLSMKDDKVFMREGPSDKHRIKWVYHRKGLPVEVLSAFEVWRRVRDMDGEIGWIHVALLSRDRTAVVVGTGDVSIRRNADADSAIVAEAQPGAIGQLEDCAEAACQVKFETAEGWIDRARLWGVHAGKNY
jgi:SH3-like domain-containing protein